MEETMKISLTAVLTGFFVTLPLTATAQSPSDHDAVKLVLQNFLRAYVTDDADLIRKTFRQDGVMIGYSKRANKLVTTGGEEFATRFDGKPADDEAQRKRSFEILDITGDAALGKVVLDYPNWKGVDYLALFKIDGEWKIATKSWGGYVPTAKK
jgi:hypothetical protein